MFINFHCHSVYSQQDAMSEPIDIAKINKEMGNDAFCITDHGTLGSLIQAYIASDKTGLQFIPGCEFYVLPEPEYWAYNNKNNDEVETVDFACKYHHLIAIAKNQKGLESLIAIYNSHHEYYGKPCVTREDIFSNSEGLIIMTACVASEFVYYIKNDMVDKARDILKMYKDKFGDDFYVELQYHHLTDVDGKSELEIYNTLVSLARELDIEMVPTTDSHFNYKEDANDHNIYKALFKPGGGVTPYDYDNNSFKKIFDGEGYYIMNEDEITESISNITSLSQEDVRHVIDNTVVIRNKCEKTHFPKAKKLSDKSRELRALVEKGFEEERKGTEYEQESRERIEFELKTINDMGFSEYFINVYTIVNRARMLNILPGPARGSAAGSEVCYLTGITSIDPLKNKLMFERFLNPARFNYPDIDLDIQSYIGTNNTLGKDALIKSLSYDKFPFSGQIVNEVRASTIILFKKLGSAMGIPFGSVNKITTDSEVSQKYLLEDTYTGWIPDQLNKLGINYDYKWQEFEKYVDFCYKYGGSEHGDNAKGLLWNSSVHASGVIFYPVRNKNYLPKNSQGIIFRGHLLEAMGLIKYDLLSLDALNPICYFIPRIEKDTGRKFNWEDTSDRATWETIKSGDTSFTFQFSSAGMKRALKVIKPDSIDILAELNSLYRPGCIKAGIFERYLKDDWTDEEKVVGEFLKEEFGEQHSYAMIFQEDIMKVVEKMAGFSLADADLVRRAMQRKEKDTMDSYKQQFLDGFNVEKYGDIAETVWDTIEAFATYTFNKSHSVAYSCVAYWTAYIFTHYKYEYFAFLLNMNKQKREIIKYLSKDHKIVYPSISTKNTEFAIDDDNVFLPTIEPQEDTSIVKYLLSLNANKKTMIVKYGILDDFCVDRKNMRDIFNELNKKKIANLTEQQMDSLESATMPELINKLSALDFLDYENLGNGHYHISVKKPKSVKEFDLHMIPDRTILKNNCQEDVRAYGIVRSLYCDELPEVPYDFFVEKLESIDDPDIDKRRFLDKMSMASPIVARINSENSWYRVVCKESKLTGWPKATIIFNNDIVDMKIPRRLVGFFKSLDKNEPLEIRVNLNFYLNRDGDVAYSFEVVEATLDGVNCYSK